MESSGTSNGLEGRELGNERLLFLGFYSVYSICLLQRHGVKEHILLGFGETAH